MTLLPFLLFPVVIYVVPMVLGVFAVSCLMGQKLRQDVLMYSLVPIGTWLVLVLYNGKGKTLSNLVVEPLVMAVITCMLIAIRYEVEKQAILTGKPLNVVTALICLLIAACCFAFMPALPE